MLEIKQSPAGNYTVCRRVWQRVDPQQEPYPEQKEESPATTQPGQERQILEDLLSRKRQGQRDYQLWARQVPMGVLRQKLHQLAAEKAGQVRRLLAAYYLLTENQLASPIPVGGGKLDPWRQMLRRKWFEELDSAGQMEHLAEHLPELEGLFMELAQEDRRHGELLLRLLAQSLA